MMQQECGDIDDQDEVNLCGEERSVNHHYQNKENSFASESVETNSSADCIHNHKPKKTEDFDFSSSDGEADLKSDLIKIKCKSLKKTGDPFALSSDEDTAEPKVKPKYRPLKRKFSTGCIFPSLNNDQMDFKVMEDISLLQQSEDSCDSLPQKCPKNNDLQQKRKLKISYVHSDDLLAKTNKMLRIEGRAELVHSLISAFGLLQYVDIISPRPATEEEISGFHGMDYIDHLKQMSCKDYDSQDSVPAVLSEEEEDYGLAYDCPPMPGIFETSSLIGGATICAAQSLVDGRADIAINWYGGWHHAKRSTASGFCYINDIVLGILKLREKFARVLYVDIDLHHGDGVEEAFSMTPKVMTVSFHKYDQGFFPGSGGVHDVGEGRGKHFAINVPLKDGIRDAQYFAIFSSVMKLVCSKFSPDALVVQCGADGLNGDPMASFNLTHIGVARCVCYLLTWGLPTLLVGGGGYNFPNTAKCWAYLTALAAGRKLPSDVPEHQHFMEYGPDFEMSVEVGNRKDCNSQQYLKDIVGTIQEYLR